MNELWQQSILTTSGWHKLIRSSYGFIVSICISDSHKYLFIHINIRHQLFNTLAESIPFSSRHLTRMPLTVESFMNLTAYPILNLRIFLASKCLIQIYVCRYGLHLPHGCLLMPNLFLGYLIFDTLQLHSLFNLFVLRINAAITKALFDLCFSANSWKNLNKYHRPHTTYILYSKIFVSFH